MKSTLLPLTLLIGLLLVNSCTTEDALKPNNNLSEVSENAFADLYREIEMLNSSFLNSVPKIRQLDFDNYGDMQGLYEMINEAGLLEVHPSVPFYPEAWNVADVDAKAYEISKNYGANDATAKKASAMASAAYELEEQKKQEKEVTAEYEKDVNNNKIYYADRVDPMWPINPNATVDFMTGYPEAVAVGKEHNRVIQRVHEDMPDFVFNENQNMVAEYIDYISSTEFGNDDADLDAASILDWMQQAIDVILEYPICEDRYFHIMNNFGYEDEGFITGTYMIQVSKLSGAVAMAYTNDFINIVNRADISAHSKKYIYSSLSTSMNSRFLWNMQLPNPMEQSSLIVYNSRTYTWDFISLEDYLRRYSGNTSDIWGVPKFDSAGKISAVILFTDYGDYLPFRQTVLNQLISSGRIHVDVQSQFYINNEYSQNHPHSNGIISVSTGSYPLYKMHGSEGIYVINLER